MGNRNTNLQRAKNAKYDESFTMYEDIEQEVFHYVHHFKGKTVYCNCDEPQYSNFCRYFLKNFKTLGLKRLICTSLAGGSRPCSDDLFSYALNGTCTGKTLVGRGSVLDVS